MKLTNEQKKVKANLLKIAKNYNDKNKLALVIDFLNEKDIAPESIELKRSFAINNGTTIDFDLVVYKEKANNNPADVILAVKLIDSIKDDRIITITSYNSFAGMPNLFFVLFFDNNKNTTLTFKTISNDRMLVNKTNHIPSFKWA